MKNTSANSFYGAIKNIIAAGKGNSPAITEGDFTLTYDELLTAIDAYSEKLLSLGIKKQDHVALWAFNSADWLVAFLSIIRIGGVAVLLNYNLQMNDLAALSQLTDVKFIAFGKNRETLQDQNAASVLAKKINIDDSALIPILDCSKLKPSASFTQERFVDISIEESQNTVALIIFTTGTTAAPKAVLITQYGFLSDANDVKLLVPNISSSTVCAVIPFFHSFGLSCTMAVLNYGSHLIVVEFFKPEIIINAIYKNKADSMASVGTIYFALIEQPNFAETISKQVKLCITGGGALTQTQLMRLETSFKKARFINGYGQTESSTFISIPSPTDSVELRSKSVGKPVASKDVKIMNSAGDILPAGEIGEIVIFDQGNIMKGYYKLPKEKQAIDENGYLHSGDLGYFDQKGYLFLAGRLKDIIIKGGENISPIEIEKELTKLPGIREAKVMGAPNQIYGESIEACITCFEKDKFNEDSIRAQIKAVIGSFKTPAHFFLYDRFPLNANNKLDQRTLRIDMLNKLRSRILGETLNSGMQVMKISIKYSSYNIVPIAAMIEALAFSIGFSNTRAHHIRLAVEEMLTERIVNISLNTESIDVAVVFMPDWLRVQISDDGAKYDIHKDEATNISAKLIMSMVDSFSTLETENQKPIYCLDFLYEKEFDIKNFLLSHEKTQGA